MATITVHISVIAYKGAAPRISAQPSREALEADLREYFAEMSGREVEVGADIVAVIEEELNETVHTEEQQIVIEG